MQHRLIRIARGITSIIHPKGLNEDLGYEQPHAGAGRHLFRFETKSGRVFQVSISVDRKHTIPARFSEYDAPESLTEFATDMVKPFYGAYIEFKDPDNRFGATGKGESKQIFSKVIQIVYQFLSKNPHIALVTFSGEGASRVRMYNRFARMIAGDLDYGSLEVLDDDFKYLMPSRFYDPKAAQEAIDTPPTKEDTEQGVPDPNPETEPETDPETVLMEQAQLRRLHALEDAMQTQIQNRLQPAIVDVKQKYEDTQYGYHYKKYRDPIYEDLAGKGFDQDWGQRLLWEDDDLRRGIDEGRVNRVGDAADARMEEEFPEWWEKHLKSMQFTFEDTAWQKLNQDRDIWEQVWMRENPIEIFVDREPPRQPPGDYNS